MSKAAQSPYCDVSDDGWTDLILVNSSEMSILEDPGSFVMLNGPGNIMDRGPDEYYVSVPFNLPRGAQVTEISWKGQVPPKPP